MNTLKRSKALEISAAILGLLVLGVGLIAVIRPKAQVIPHFVNDYFGIRPRYEMNALTPTETRAYGGLASLVGLGIITLALYHPKQ